MESFQRKPRDFFDITPHPTHVTFDDAKDWRRNFPWSHYSSAFWSYADPDTIRVEIDEWLVVICGHNLEPLFRAIEEQTLVRIRAYPDWEHDQNRAVDDTFATSIRFAHVGAFSQPGFQKRTSQLDFPFSKSNGTAGPEVQK